MTGLAFILGILTGIVGLLILGLWAGRHGYAQGGQVVAVMVETEGDEPESMADLPGGDPLAITCRACDAPPGIGCAVLSNGTDRVEPHLIRQQDVGRRKS